LCDHRKRIDANRSSLATLKEKGSHGEKKRRRGAEEVQKPKEGNSVEMKRRKDK